MLYLGHPCLLPGLLARMGPRTVASPRAVRRWLQDTGVPLQGYEVDHIVPRSLGGIDHPHNYAVVERELNRRWSANWSCEKRQHLGPHVVAQALRFAQWSTAQSTVSFSRFAAAPPQRPCTAPWLPQDGSTRASCRGSCYHLGAHTT